MMYISLGVVTRLCWVLSLITLIVRGQFFGNDAAIAAKLEGLRAQGLPLAVDGSGTAMGRPTNALMGGDGQKRSTDNRIQSTKNQIPIEAARSTQTPTTLRPAIPESTASPSTLRAAIPSPEISSAPPPSTLRAGIPSAESDLPPSTLRAAIPTPEPTTSGFIDAIITNTSSIATTTVPTSVQFLTSTQIVPTEVVASSTPDPALAEENNASARPSESSFVEPAPPFPTTDSAMSPTSMAGMGVGVTFGVLSIAGVAGIFLWRRHQNQRSDIASNISEDSTFLGRLFGLKRYQENKEDPEWSIESAEKVAIVKNMRAQRVSTSSRSNSRGSDGSKSGSRGAELEPPPRRKSSMPNTALGSHPVTPDISSFPLPPSSSAIAKTSETQLEEGKKANWPLSE